MARYSIPIPRTLAGHANAAFKLYPGLNHLFMAGSGRGTGLSTPEDYQQPGHIAEEVVHDLAAWVESRGGKSP